MSIPVFAGVEENGKVKQRQALADLTGPPQEGGSRRVTLSKEFKNEEGCNTKSRVHACFGSIDHPLSGTLPYLRGEQMEKTDKTGNSLM